jgi:hypothetical protein
MDSDWQNKRIPDLRLLNYVQKRANEKHSYRNTRLWEFYWQNTAFYRFKMSLFGAVWLADLRFLWHGVREKVKNLVLMKPVFRVSVRMLP